MELLTSDFIRAEFIEGHGTLLTVSEKHGIPLKGLEDYCFRLCKEQPDSFEYKLFLTEDWFSEKLPQYESLVELSNDTGIHYRTLCYFKERFFPEKRRQLAKEISYDDLWRMYVDDEMTDKEIALKYETNTANIKRLRQAYDIMASDRKPLEEKLPIELFHRVYVLSKLGLGQIAMLFGSSRTSVTELRDKYASCGHPLSTDIADTNNVGAYPRFLEDILQVVSKKELCRELQTKTIYEIASHYGIIAHTANSLKPLSKEWLKAELMTKSISIIASENHKSVSWIWKLIDEYGLDRFARTNHIEEDILRELFINRCWSDATIGKHFGVSASTVKKERLGYKIFSEQRPSIEDRITVPLFRYLYIEERMSLLQIASAYNVSGAKLRALRKKYVDEGNADLAHRTSGRVTPERLEYLNKQIHLNLLKK